MDKIQSRRNKRRNIEKDAGEHNINRETKELKRERINEESWVQNKI